MGTKAEELGVEIYPGFAASQVLLLPINILVDSFLIPTVV